MEGPNYVFLAIVRHGERADLAPEDNMVYDVKDDPPLTKIGLSQAEETAYHLRALLAEKQIEEVFIESSPFIRCLKTGSIIAKALGVQKMLVNYKYSEMLKPTHYKNGNPIPTLEMKVKPYERIVDEYLDGVEFEDNDIFLKEILKQYPED